MKLWEWSIESSPETLRQCSKNAFSCQEFGVTFAIPLCVLY